ncbi:MAG: discoidin domain-containing protein [Terriglobia bacterium]
MKKLIGIAIGGAAVLVVAATLAVVGYRQGWFSRTSVKSQETPAGAGGATGSPGTGAPAPSATGAPTTTQAGQPQAGQPASPQFDGNVAALAWGGKVESATGTAPDDAANVDWLSDLIDGNPDTYWHTPVEVHGPTEIVLSFAEHDSVRIDQVKIISHTESAPRDVEVWVSDSGPAAGFTRVATATLPNEDERTIRFDPVETRYVKLRLLHNFNDQETFEIGEIKVLEAPRPGYTPLLARHPELNGPSPANAGAAVAAAASPPVCVPLTSATLTPGHGESKRVLVLTPDPWSIPEKAYGGLYLKNRPEYRQKYPDLEVAARADITVVAAKRAQVQMLTPKYGYDTVVLEQCCQDKGPGPAFMHALIPWLADGHKLIIQDADNCTPGPDYGWLPYHFKTDNPGGHGAAGNFLRFTEENWMAHARKGRPGFIDTEAWENSTDDYRNELGDSNTLTEWDPHWCGHMVVRNVNNVFGFVFTYAHYGRGLIIYSGFDIDMIGSLGYDLMVARELAQGFDPDNLPCSARIGDFVVTTNTGLMQRPFVPGRSYDYPLTLLSNQGYKGTIGLSVKANPGLEGMQANFAPASVALDGLAESKFRLTVPANAPSTPQALEVKGIDAGGKTNSLCLQLVQPQTGELSVVSTLGRPPKASKNLEIILDASGSMKLPLGKKTRWTTAHDMLQQMLATLPSDFNVGLRIYGHRESSRSPKTCTDSELVLPIQKLDPQAILHAAEAVHPRGETPLVYSVLQSTTDLKDVGGGTVIVITDGEESCHGDPVKAAATLKASGLDIVLNIVGFTTGQSVQKQLGGFAQATGGRFYAADSGPALARALQMAAVERFPYTVLDAAGKEVTSGEAGDAAVELPAGEYTVVVTAGETNLKAEHVRVALAQQTVVRIAQKNGQFVLQQ